MTSVYFLILLLAGEDSTMRGLCLGEIRIAMPILIATGLAEMCFQKAIGSLHLTYKCLLFH